jgi:hypothetical protein
VPESRRSTSPKPIRIPNEERADVLSLIHPRIVGYSEVILGPHG